MEHEKLNTHFVVSELAPSMSTGRRIARAG